MTITSTFIGQIDQQNWVPGATASVEFDRFPTSFAEFEQAHRVLAAEPHGAIAAEVMAFECYRRDAALGTECLKLANTPNNVNAVTSRLKELFRPNDSYARPYQAAAFLKGASPDNGYQPTRPFTVEVRVSPVNAYQQSTDYRALMLYLEINSFGHQTNWRAVYVVRPAGSQHFLVNNNPGMYSQCIPLGPGQVWAGLA